MSAKSIARGTTWADEKAFPLISICADENIQQQLDSSRKKPVYEKIAKRLKEEGDYKRSCLQISEKTK